MKELTSLIRLVHNRWAVPVIAMLHRGRGAKFITLANRLAVSRDSLRRTLHALIEAGLVCKNPGHGHPMRPEYVLTPRGSRVGAAAATLEQALRRHGGVVYKKWSLPTLMVLADQPLGFNTLKRRLGGATSRAVSLTLKELELAGLVRRAVEDAHPPTVSYELSRMGKRITEPTTNLAHAL